MANSSAILTTLNNTGLSQKDPVLYQTIKALINNLIQAENELATILSPTVVGSGKPVIAPVNGTYVTATNQVPYLPYSTVLTAGTNVTLDASVKNVLTINASATSADTLSPFLLMGA